MLMNHPESRSKGRCRTGPSRLPVVLVCTELHPLNSDWNQVHESVCVSISAEEPVIILIMGTTGSGKTTIGTLLARSLDWEFADGDDFHPPSNVEKMRHGIPLTDQDREPWLQTLHDKLVKWSKTSHNAVLACSALKEAYRRKLLAGLGSNEVALVYLKGTYELFSQRVLARKGHFAKQNLIASQFADLEEPTDAITVDAAESAEKIVAEIRRRLGFSGIGVDSGVRTSS
jgi:gluconokinase